MKRLIICADGTWNSRDQINDDNGKRRPTNVTKVARAIRSRDERNVDQVVFYHDGLGTHGPIDKFTGGAFGTGIEENIRTLYRHIVYNHEQGDEIFLFGFSRGAFTVRTLAGFMKFAGVVEKEDDYFVPDLFSCYERSKGRDSQEWKHATRHIRQARECPKIKFIGVWDTVGSLGAPGLLGQFLNKNKYDYHDTRLFPEIEHAYHALAIDERRKPFKPTLWEKPADWKGTLEQAWFAGVHSNIGGSYDPDGLANEALHWICDKATAAGLQFDGEYLKAFSPCFNSTLNNSMSPKYQVMGEHLRPIGRFADVLHRSAYDRHRLPEMKYAPSNLMDYLERHGPVANAESKSGSAGMPCPPMPIRPADREP